MIVEILEILDFIINGNIHYLPIHFLVFVLIACIIKKIYPNNRRYKPKISKYREKDVSVIIPCYNEDRNILESAIKSVLRLNPLEVIVSLDGKNKHLDGLVKKMSGKVKFIKNGRVGKRKAIIEAVERARGKIVLLMDSDTIIKDRNFLKKALPYFYADRIVGVGTVHELYYTGSKVALIMGNLIERAREIVDRFLATRECLNVLDGKASLWRRDYILRVKNEFLNKTFLGRPCHIGDDKELTYLAYKHGYGTTFSPEAKITSAAQESFIKFIKQQIRWNRSGYRFFIERLLGVYKSPSIIFSLHEITYYLSPVSFMISLLLDVFYLPKMEILYIPLFLIPLTLWMGTILLTILVQLIYFGKVITGKYTLITAPIGLFIIFPARIYALLTVWKQDIWGTRNKRKDYGFTL